MRLDQLPTVYDFGRSEVSPEASTEIDDETFRTEDLDDDAEGATVPALPRRLDAPDDRATNPSPPPRRRRRHSALLPSQLALIAGLAAFLVPWAAAWATAGLVVLLTVLG